MEQDTKSLIAGLRAQLLMEQTASECLLLNADKATLVKAMQAFITVSAETTNKLLFSGHPDAAAQGAQAHRERLTVSFAAAVAAREGSSHE